MSIVKTAAALIALATIAGVAAPAYAQYGAPTAPTGGWINSANRDFYTPWRAPSAGYATTDGYASTECTTARVKVRLRSGKVVTRLREVCP